MPFADSQHIFEKADCDYKQAMLVVGLSILVVAASAVLWFRNYRRKKKGWTYPNIILGILFLNYYYVVPFYAEYKIPIRIKEHYAETFGTTIDADTPFQFRKTKGPEYRYFYVVDSIIRESISLIGDGSKLKLRGGKYIVIYNSQWPGDAFLIVDRPAPDSSTIDPLYFRSLKKASYHPMI